MLHRKSLVKSDDIAALANLNSWAAFQASIRANGEDDLKAYLAALESAREQGYDTVHRSEPRPPFALAEAALPGRIMDCANIETRIGRGGSPIRLKRVRWRDASGEFYGVIAADSFEDSDCGDGVILDVEGGLRGDGQVGMWIHGIHSANVERIKDDDFSDAALAASKVIDLQIYRWAKWFTNQPPDERRHAFFRARLAGRSATEAYNRPLRPRAAGASVNISDAEQAFRDAARGYGITLPEKLRSDKMQRFNPATGNGKGGSGFCRFYTDGIPAGIFGDWATGVKETWSSSKLNGSMTEHERLEHNKRVNTLQRERELEERRQQKAVAKEVGELHKGSEPAPDSHPYLLDKQVRAYGLRVHKDHPGKLFMFLQDVCGVIWSYQTIDEAGNKSFRLDGRVAGLYFLIGGPIDPGGMSYTGEGYATMATVYEASGRPCVVALDAGNVPKVARALREVPSLKKAPFTICADSDAWTPGDPGGIKALEAARAIDALIATPVFVQPRVYPMTDFNDLYRVENIDSVRRCLDAATAPPPVSENIIDFDTAKKAKMNGADPADLAADLRAAGEYWGERDKAEYATNRKSEADRLHVRVGDLDHEVNKARARKTKEARAEKMAAVAPGETPHTLAAVSMDDFYAVLPQAKYLYTPTRAMWTAETINRLFGPTEMGEPTPAMILDQMRGVQAMTWAPGLPLIVKNRLVHDAGWIDRADCCTVNLYRPPTIGKGDANDVDPWLDLVRKIYPERMERLLDFLAWPVQHPDIKINHALLMGGPPNIGKDTWLEPLKRAVGPWNFKEASPTQLMGRFNGFLKAVVLRVSEARDLGDIDRYALYEKTKTMWANPPDMHMIDEKNTKEYPVVNVVAGIITTNHRTDALYLPSDDRRHFVLWSNVTTAEGPEYFKALWRWYDAGGFENVAAFLKARDLSGFNPKEPPEKTPAFWAIVNNAVPPEESELRDILDEMGWPNALTLDQVIFMAIPPQAKEKGEVASNSFAGWLSDRRNARSIPHKFDRCGYVALHNTGSKDGRWKVGGKWRTIYVKKDLPGPAQYAAAEALRHG